jgi:hypothetical protein
MIPARTIALLTGVFFILTFVTSIPAVLLYGPILSDPNYITGSGADGQVYLGAFLEVLLAVGNIGTAVMLFPILKRENEPAALGYVASRVVESAMILVGAIALLSAVTLRIQLAGTIGSSESAIVVGRSLVAIHDWTFLMGPGFAVGVNDLLLGYLLYRTGLVPRWLALLGIIGGPIHFLSDAAQLFAIVEPFSTPRAITTIPVFFFEAILGIWLIVRGFTSAPVLIGYERERRVGAGA